ncbi:MAG TPA: Sec-independent protein translocase protein TatB [Rhizomicrobium sp.]|jgi:sec-independent protein translocase protein TatB|nr:Sec-independent protein translocase protein TatB [Rhizomicrobium sp.]
MFDIFSWQHILILLVVALVVVGPKDLPRLMNMAGKWAGKARNMANEFRRSFDEMARQAELDELRKEIEALKKNNPVSEIADTVAGVEAEVNRPVETAAGTPAADAAPLEGTPEPRSGEFEITTREPHGGEFETTPASGPPKP